MAQLTIFTETEMFHSACRCNWDGHVEWYGFKPVRHSAPAGKGFVDCSDGRALIKHYLVFDVNAARLRAAIRAVKPQYDNSLYAVTFHDCVSFSADIARHTGLRVPLVNIMPYGFLEVLALWNKYTSKE